MSSEIVGIVLAAGRSSRFGAPKQLLELDGEPLVRRAARIALESRLTSVRVVIGPHAAAMRRTLADLDVLIVENPAYAEGLSTSVRAGLARLDGAAAAVFLPVDQPWLTARLIDRLIATHGGSPGTIVVPRAGARRGAPVLWDRAFFRQLRALEGDVGGRVLLRRHGDRIRSVEVEDPLELADIDTPEDHQRLTASAGGRIQSAARHQE